jgi:hypothetical protein
MVCRPWQLHALKSWHLRIMIFSHLICGFTEGMGKVAGNFLSWFQDLEDIREDEMEV